MKMGVNWVEIGVQVRKFVIYSLKKSVSDYPILVGLVFCLIFLYRSFPFVFSVLISSSPVLVCTAVLLGTLLSFGQPNIPEVEKDELKTAAVSREILSLNTGVFRNDAIIVEGNYETCSVERYTEKSRDLVSEKSFDEPSLVAATNNYSEYEADDGTTSKEISQESQFEKLGSTEISRELDNLTFDLRSKLNGCVDETEHAQILKVGEEGSFELGNCALLKYGDSVDHQEFFETGLELKGGLNEQKVIYGQEVEGNDYIHIQKESEENNLELGTQSLQSRGSFDMQRAGLLDSYQDLEWEQEVREQGDREDDDEEDDLDSDSDSDRAESSSPDASMADIIPMLEELHPLLDEDVPSQPVQDFHEGYDAVSQHSPESVDSCDESDDEDFEIQEDLVGIDHDDDNDDANDEEEETLGGEEDSVKHAITWTEDDQKNLMDLGSSELERNQRLESLIARRRLRRSMKILAEKNLIDFDSADLPFIIAPISTRKNPFDIPHDSNDMGLPPIPGSAPSILAPRRNPFDLPYDSGEEKPNLKEDSFQKEFTPFQPKETFFRRHESFNVGPLFFGGSKPDNQGSNLRPLFVPEQRELEGTSHPAFQRQSSELSDSNVSSVPETDSVSSIGDPEKKKLVEEEILQEVELLSRRQHIPDHDAHEISPEHRVSGAGSDTESLHLVGNLEHNNLVEGNNSQDAELISDMAHVSQHVAHGSQSSDDVHSVELGRVENKEAELEEENIRSCPGRESGLPETGYVDSHVDLNGIEKHVKAVTGQTFDMNDDSISLEKEDERFSSLEDGAGDLVMESGMSAQQCPEDPETKITYGLVDETHSEEPVYDLSPTPSAVEKTLSSSISDFHAEISDTCLPPVVIKRTVPLNDDESELSHHEMEKDVGHDTQILTNSVQVHAVDESDFVLTGITEISEKRFKQLGFSEVEQSSNTTKVSVEPQISFNHETQNNAFINEEIFPDSSEPHVERDLQSSEIVNVAKHEEEKEEEIVDDVVTSPESGSCIDSLEKDPTIIKEILEADLLQLHVIGEDELTSTGVTHYANVLEISGTDRTSHIADRSMVPEILLEPSRKMKNDTLSSKENWNEDGSSKVFPLDKSEVGSKGVPDAPEQVEFDGTIYSINSYPEAVVHNYGFEEDSCNVKEILETDSLQPPIVDEKELLSVGEAEIMEHDTKNFGMPEFARNADSTDALMLPETLDHENRLENDYPINKEILADLLELHVVDEGELGLQGVRDVTEHAEVVSTADGIDNFPEAVMTNHATEEDHYGIREIVEADSLQLHAMDENKLDSTEVTVIGEHDVEISGIFGVDRTAGSSEALLVSKTLEPLDAIENDAPTNEEKDYSFKQRVIGENASGSGAVVNVTDPEKIVDVNASHEVISSNQEMENYTDITNASLMASHEAASSNQEMENNTDTTNVSLMENSLQSDAVDEYRLDSAGIADLAEQDTLRVENPSVKSAVVCADAPTAPETPEPHLGMENDNPNVKKLLADTDLHEPGKHELEHRVGTDISERDVKKEETMIDQHSERASTSAVPESIS